MNKKYVNGSAYNSEHVFVMMRIHRSYAVNIEHILYIYMYCAATPLIPNLNQKSTSTWERHSFATNLNSTQ